MGVECRLCASSESNPETRLIDRSIITECYAFVYMLCENELDAVSRWDILTVVLPDSDLPRESFLSYIQDTPHKIIPSQVLVAIKNFTDKNDHI